MPEKTNKKGDISLLVNTLEKELITLKLIFKVIKLKILF